MDNGSRDAPRNFVTGKCRSPGSEEWQTAFFWRPANTGIYSGTDSRLELSDEHYKDGLQSLSWTFNPGAVLSIKKDLKFEKKDPTGKDTYLSAFIVWVYNEQAQDKKIEFEFLKDGKKCTSFPFGINFTGWRAAWVCYERDMVGTPEEGMNEIRIIAPDTKGKLYLDHIIPASKVDARQQAADVQVPFVNKGTTNHWLVITNIFVEAGYTLDCR